jgi:hypothetical protein
MFLSLMAATVVAVVAYGTAVAANMAHTPLSDPENPDASPSPSVQFTLTVHAVGSGEGSVTVSGVGSCSDECRMDVGAGSVLDLSAQPGSQSRFVRWGGACHGRDGCTVNMVESRTAVAVFVKAKHHKHHEHGHHKHHGTGAHHKHGKHHHGRHEHHTHHQHGHHKHHHGHHHKHHHHKH